MSVFICCCPKTNALRAQTSASWKMTEIIVARWISHYPAFEQMNLRSEKVHEAWNVRI